MTPQEQRRNCRVQLGGEGTVVWKAEEAFGLCACLSCSTCSWVMSGC